MNLFIKRRWVGGVDVGSARDFGMCQWKVNTLKEGFKRVLFVKLLGPWIMGQ